MGSLPAAQISPPTVAATHGGWQNNPSFRCRQARFMTVEQLRNMHRATPFVPFDIHLADGRALPVQHPEMLAISAPGRTIGVAQDDGTIEIVDLLLVTTLKPRSNGASRRRRSR
jgi:hypothetical protein